MLTCSISEANLAFDLNSEAYSEAPRPRIAPVEKPYQPETESALDSWMLGPRPIEPLRLFRTLAVHDTLAASMLPMHSRILGAQAMVPPILREVMIHRTSALTGSEYEWGVHVVGFGKPVGLTDAQLESTVRGAATDECWDGPQASVFRLADEMHKTCRVSDELWSLLSSHFVDRQILELVTMAGWYHLIAYVCNAVELEPETWAARFPLETARPDDLA